MDKWTQLSRPFFFFMKGLSPLVYHIINDKKKTKKSWPTKMAGTIKSQIMVVTEGPKIQF